jgi:hypothetical protein
LTCGNNLLAAGLERSGPIDRAPVHHRHAPRLWKYGRAATGTITAVDLVASVVVFAPG